MGMAWDWTEATVHVQSSRGSFDSFLFSWHLLESRLGDAHLSIIRGSERFSLSSAFVLYFRCFLHVSLDAILIGGLARV